MSIKSTPGSHTLRQQGTKTKAGQSQTNKTKLQNKITMMGNSAEPFHSQTTQNYKLTDPRSAVVSASDSGSDSLGFESHLGVLRAQWEGWDHTAELHTFQTKMRL